MIQRYHVMPTADHSWAVRVPGASRASKRFTYQEDAVQWAKDRAWDVVMHDLTGRIVERWFAWLLVERMRGRGWMVSLDASPSGEAEVSVLRETNHRRCQWEAFALGVGDTTPLAICRAALQALEAHA